MLAAVDFIIHEQEAMLNQIGFLKRYATTWGVSPAQAEPDQKALTQLIHIIFYLKEGLESFYLREDNFLLSKIESSFANEIKRKHKDVMDSTAWVYRSLVEVSSKVLQINRGYLSETIEGLCQIISRLSAQENEILRSLTN